jgi:hypothetical protein
MQRFRVQDIAKESLRDSKAQQYSAAPGSGNIGRMSRLPPSVQRFSGNVSRQINGESASPARSADNFDITAVGASDRTGQAKSQAGA